MCPFSRGKIQISRKFVINSTTIKVTESNEFANRIDSKSIQICKTSKEDYFSTQRYPSFHLVQPRTIFFSTYRRNLQRTLDARSISRQKRRRKKGIWVVRLFPIVEHRPLFERQYQPGGTKEGRKEALKKAARERPSTKQRPMLTVCLLL